MTFYPGEQLRLLIHVGVPSGASGTLVNRAEVEGGGAAPVAAESSNPASAEEAQSGLEEFRAALTGADGLPVHGADSHPYQYTTSFAVNLNPNPDPTNIEDQFIPAKGDLKDLEFPLPPGLVGNPTAVRRCTAQQFNTIQLTKADSLNECPDGSAVGVIAVRQLEGGGELSLAPLYDLVPPRGMPAQLGFQVLGLPFYIDTKLRSDGDYGITAYLQNTAEAKRITAAQATIWGVPADPSHDRLRGHCVQTEEGGCPPEAHAVERPFLRLPSSCELQLPFSLSFDTWLHPEIYAGGESVEPVPVGCAVPPFEPSIEAQPTSSLADSGTGLNIDLHVPQPEGCSEEAKVVNCEIGEADLRDAKVVLPAGMTVNPSSADGLGSCSEAQVGYLPQRSAEAGHPRFTSEAAECPDASKVGSVEVFTPLLGHPLPGAMYLAAQDANPFGSLLAVYIAVYDPVSGVVVKLPGRVTLDAASGQLTASFEENPQLPFNDFKVDLFSGSRAALTTPFGCGSYSASTLMTSWGAPEGKDATPSSQPFTVAGAPGGAPCVAGEAQAPNTPMFEAGTASPVAGAFSPFVLKLAREDASQHFSGLNVTLPRGLLGKIAGLPQCPQAAIEAALARSHEGEGAVELAQPSCPRDSEVGVVRVGAGSSAPYYVTGHAYFAGPYKGAPFSMVIVTPAVAGPFDLGAVVVRAGLYVDPSTAQVTVRSDPFPAILDGIPLDIRSVGVEIGRPGFTFNPTSCDVMAVTGEESSAAGQTAGLSDRFQAGGCTSLPFHPTLTASTQGKTSKVDGASLNVVVSSAGLGQANIAKVELTIPKILPSRLTTLQKACTDAQFNANPAGCPTASDIATAVVHTPILSSPLVGPAYFVSHGAAAFPDVEIVLQGEGVKLVLDGKTQIKDGVTYSRFETVPDAPFTTFEFNAPQGPYSIFTAIGNLCATKTTKTVTVKKRVKVKHRGQVVRKHGRVVYKTKKVKKNLSTPQSLTIPTEIVGQNGAVIEQNTKVAVTGCTNAKPAKKAKKKAKKKNGKKSKKHGKRK
ncbi:MAG: hypothetical protein ACRDK7_04745 [Solirubrobacteraceae bacterium]